MVFLTLMYGYNIHCTVCVESSESVIRLYVKVEGEEAGGSGDSGDDGGDAVVGREVSIT